MLRSFWTPLALSLVAFAVGMGAGLSSKTGGISKSKNQIDLERIAATDFRIEHVARAICIARGIDPDHEGPPYPSGPLWEIFILQARDYLAEYDAATTWTQRKPGRNGPPN